MNHRLRVERMQKAAVGGEVHIDELLSAQLSQEKLQPHRSQPAQDAGQLERRDSIDAEHVERGGVVAEDQRTAVARAPPQALPPERQLPVRKRQSHVSIEYGELIHGRLAAVGGQLRKPVYLLNGFTRRERQRRQARRALPFPAEIGYPP